ncbi:HFX_2341 family transcriptional regulator domain-containing protein [Methanotorris formicicus]|uniref:HFX-2341-like N-terminal domain-containing protein n=1 Tax=Methanotorris formicicus Mc-S-70 TaxID=647171 RepID=H1KZH3_9EURY|nr:DUF6293 family protein [Methanotorris formicicus]EHP85981.1 hypothetical protein MetfoDRAFT_1196 [Methanotorris formicicus Mc-S-70]
MVNDLEKIRGGVHIAVQGYEVDRITEVPIMRRAEKVYLICMNENTDSEIGKAFKEIIIKRFKEKGINYEVVYADLFDLEDIVQKMKSIIICERREYGDVKFYINVSSGSTIGCIAGITCAMILNKNNSRIIPYYVVPKTDSLSSEEKEVLKKEYLSKYNCHYLPRTFGVVDAKLIYPFEVNLPREELLIFLKFIGRAGDDGLSIKELSILTKEDFLRANINDNESIRKLIEVVDRKDYVRDSDIKRMRDLVVKLNKIVGADKDDLKKLMNWRKKSMDSNNSTKQSDLVWISKNVVEKLLEWELIEKPEKIGRSKYIKINEKGKMLLNYVG